MTDPDPKESDSQKRPSIEVNSPILSLVVVGSEGETIEDIEPVYEKQLQKTAKKIEQLANEVDDKTYV